MNKLELDLIQARLLRALAETAPKPNSENRRNVSAHRAAMAIVREEMDAIVADLPPLAAGAAPVTPVVPQVAGVSVVVAVTIEAEADPNYREKAAEVALSIVRTLEQRAKRPGDGALDMERDPFTNAPIVEPCSVTFRVEGEAGQDSEGLARCALPKDHEGLHMSQGEIPAIQPACMAEYRDGNTRQVIYCHQMPGHKGMHRSVGGQTWA